MFDLNELDNLIEETFKKREKLNAALAIHYNFEKIREKLIVRLFINLENILITDPLFIGNLIENDFSKKDLDDLNNYEKFSVHIKLLDQNYLICIENQQEDLSHFHLGIRKVKYSQSQNEELRTAVIDKVGFRFDNEISPWWIVKEENIDIIRFSGFDTPEILSDLYSQNSKVLSVISSLFQKLKKVVDDLNSEPKV